MSAIVLFCLIGAAVATSEEFGGVYEEKYPVFGKEVLELRSEVLPEFKKEIEYPVYQYGRHSMHYPQQYSRMSYEYPIYGEHHYPEAYRTSPHDFPRFRDEERSIYEKSYYPEIYKELTYMSHYPYYKNYEYPIYQKYEYPVYQKYEYPVYKHEEYQTPVYTKGYPWVQYQYQREHPIYKNYAIDQYPY